MRVALAGSLICLCLASYSQADKVFLKNGSLIRGTILSPVISDTLQVEIETSRIRVPLTLVEEIRLKRGSGPRIEGYKDLSYRKSWSTALEGGVVVGSHLKQESTTLRPSFRMVQEYRAHPLLNGGIGIGIFSYKDYNLFPLTADYYAVLGKSSRSWTLYGSVGRGFARKTADYAGNFKVTGGLFYQCGLGWQERLGANTLRLKMGYAVQAIEEETELWSTYVETRTRRMNRITAQVAYVFNY